MNKSSTLIMGNTEASIWRQSTRRMGRSGLKEVSFICAESVLARQINGNVFCNPVVVVELFG
jgi:hypothetical protein